MPDSKLPTAPAEDQPRYANDSALNPPPESSWGKVLRHIPEGARVLDIGCARGSFSAAMARLKGCTVVGVEFDEEAAKLARERCEQVLVGDIEALLQSPDFPGGFDVIVAADVLEHLPRPAAVLKALRSKLKKGGVLLASIPNSTHFSIIASLAAGRFPRSREGLLDSTHIQFFGEADIRELFEKTGYAQRIVDRVRLDPRYTEFKTDLTTLPDAVVAFFDGHPNSDTYQFIIRAVPSEWATAEDREPPVATPPPPPVRSRLASELAAFEKKVAEYHIAMMAAAKQKNELLETLGEYRRALTVGERKPGSDKPDLVSRGAMPELTDVERHGLRVLFIAERDDASFRYRCINACEQLRESGVAANAVMVDDPLLLSELERYSVVILFRLRWSERVEQIISTVRQHGGALGFGVDDLIFHPSMESLLPFLEHLPRQAVTEYRELFKGLNKTFEAADFVYSSTPVISRYARVHGKPVVEHPNLLPSSFLQLSRVISPMRDVLMRSPFIGYMSGSKTHDGDIASIADAIADALTANKELKLLLAGPLGVPDALAAFSDRVVQFDYLDHRVYPWLMARCRALLAPIEVVNDFSNAKSALKIFEAGVFGIPAIASPTEQYINAIHDGVSGFLARDTQDWKAALKEVTQFRRSRQLGKHAREVALTRHSADAYRNALAQSFLPWAQTAKPTAVPAERPLDSQLVDVRDMRRAAKLARTSLKIALRSNTAAVQSIGAVRAAEVLPLPNKYATAIASATRHGTAAHVGATKLGDVLADLQEPLARAEHNNNTHPLPVSATPGAAFACTGFDPCFILPHVASVGAGADVLVVTMKASGEGSRVTQFFWAADANSGFSEENSVRFRIKLDGEWHTYVVELGAHGRWPASGVAKTRFDPMDDVGEFELSQLALVSKAAIDQAGTLDLRRTIADRFLAGEGIEIGALHNPLRVPPAAHVRYVDRLTLEDLRAEYPELAAFNLVSPSIIAEAETLEGVPNNSQQFVIANHVLEHMRDPLGSLANWLRVLRPGGVLYLSLPDHKNPHDARRAVTQFSHLLEDRDGTAAARHERDLLHYEDWTQSAHPEMTKAQQDAFTAELIRTEHRVHFHCFDLALFERVLDHALPNAGASLVELTVNGQRPDMEYIAVIRKNQPETKGKVGVDIVVPIYNAREFTQRCVESVLRYGTGDFRLVLVNDCSTDPGINQDLAEFARRDARVVVIQQEQNRGFTSTANRGMRNAGGRDVLLLNSDTEVFEGFLERLIEAAYADPQTGILTPFSNNATLCSVPEIGKDNPIPEGYTAQSFSALVSAVSQKRRPEIVTGVGFCMYVKNAVLERVGYLDEETFGRGFGEENDLVERAKKAGFKNRLCDDVFVWHKGKASFAAEGHALESKNGKLLEAKHPGYHAAVAHFFTTNPLRELHEELKFQLPRFRGAGFSAPLYLIHASPFSPDAGGTEFHLRDLLRSMKLPRAVVAWPQKGNIRVAEVFDGDVDHPRDYSFPLDAPVLRYATTHAGAEDALRKLIKLFGVRWAHIHHLFHWPLSVVDVLRAENVPVVYTSHDFYAVCPSWNLYDVKADKRCDCSVEINGPGCVTPLTQGTDEAAVALRKAHREAFQRLFSDAAGIIFPSESARRTAAKYLTLPNATAVIHHGLVSTERPAQRMRDAGAPLKVAIVGAVMIRIKGSQEYLELVGQVADANIEWHLFGPPADSDYARAFAERAAGKAKLHGSYERGQIVGKLAAEGIDVVTLLPAVDESFSFVLSEAWIAGVPVVAAKRGSLVERVEQSGAGINVDSVADAAAALRRLAAEPSLLAPYAQKAREAQLLTNDQSAEKLRRFYEGRGLMQKLSEARPIDGEALRAVYALRPIAPVEQQPAPVTPQYQRAGWYPIFQKVKPLVPNALREVGRSLLERRDAVVRLDPAARNGGLKSIADMKLLKRGLPTSRFVSLGADPRVEFAAPPISTTEVTAIRFRMKHALGQVPFAQIFWTHHADEGFTERKSAMVPVGARHSDLAEYVIHLDSPELSMLWREAQTVHRVRFDPLNVTGEFEVSPLDFVRR